MELKTPQETLDEIARFAETKGDNFNIRITRRNSVTDTAPEVWCLLNDASALQIANKETWLHPLTNRGGGIFDLFVMHSTEPMKPIGSYMRVAKNDSPRSPPDISLISKDDWKGPRTLIFPERAKSMQVTDSMPSSGNGMQMNGSGMGNHAVVMSQPAVATASSLRGTLSIADEVEKRKLDNALADMDRREKFIQEETRKIELNNMMAPLQAQLQRMEAATREAERRAEDARKDADRRIAEMSSRPAVDVTPKKSMIEELTPLLALVIPAWQSMNERSEKRQQEFIVMLKESSEKSAQNIKEVVEKLSEKKEDKGLLDLTTHVSQAFSTMSGMIVQMAHNVKDLQEPAPEQSGLVTLAEAIASPLDKLANAYFLNAQRNANAVSVVDKNKTPPQLTAAEQQADIVQPQPPVETSNQQQQPEAPSQMPNIEAIGSLIVMMQPPKNVVDYFFDHFREVDFQKLLSEKEVAGDPEKMLDYTLQQWIQMNPEKHTAYLNTVKMEFRAQSIARGVANEVKKPDAAPQKAPAAASSNDMLPRAALKVVEPQVVATTEETAEDDDLTDDEAGEADEGDAPENDLPQKS